MLPDPLSGNDPDRNQVVEPEGGSEDADLAPDHRGDDTQRAVPEVAHLANRPPQAAPLSYPGNTPSGSPVPEALTPRDAALALGACLPDGEKVPREALLADAAAELGYPDLSRQVRRALNKALKAEHNAARLRTDWDRVWRPKR